MSETKYGIIGAGYWAQNLARSLKSVGLNLAGFLDTNIEAKIDDEVRFFSTTELFNNCDAIIIATPPETHYELCKLCLENNKHVLCEKPLCFKKEEAEELVKLAESKELVFIVDETFLYSWELMAIKTFFHSKNGKYHFLTAHSTRVNNSRILPCGSIYDLTVHDVSIARYLFDDPESVTCIDTKNEDGISVSNYSVFKYEWGGFNSVSSFVNKEKMRKFGVSFLDENGYHSYIITKFDGKVSVFVEGELVQELTKEIVESFMAEHKYKVLSPLENEMTHFDLCINNKIEPISSAKNSIKTVEILEKLVESGKEGVSVNV